MPRALLLLALLPLALATHRPAEGGPPPSFRFDVLPVLQRQGCASAYCHGSATGRGGFKLSLFGSDPQADWRALAVEQDGRRLDLQTPAHSLLLQKPTMSLAHGGGRRLQPGGADYERLRGWIAAGAASDADAPLPQLELQRQGEQLTATARFADGSRRDVTSLCVFAATEERVVTVRDTGVLQWQGHGEAYVTARYAGCDAILRVTRPLPGEVADDAAIGAATHPGDRAWLGWLAGLGLRPAAPAPPPQLARRLYLDLLSRPPAPHELRAFLALPADSRVATTVAQLLQRPEFLATATARLAAWFEVPEPQREPPERQARASALRQQLQRAVADGTPLPQLGRELLQLGQPLLESFADPRDRAEFTARAFLGVRLGCARCHDHPNDRWRRSDHQAMASLVATRRGADGSIESCCIHDDDSGREVAPRPLPLGAPPPPGLDPYDQLAFAVLDGSDQFARNLCNRVLAWMLGQGLVTPADDHRLANPPVCAPLLEAMVAEWRRTGGDLRALLSFVAQSRCYAVDSAPFADAAADELAARCRARRTAFALDGDRFAASAAFVLGAAAPPLPEASLSRRLALQNGDFLAAAVAAPGNPVDAIADFTSGDEARLRELFVLVLSRPPTAAETEALSPQLQPDARAGLRRLARALILSREFESER